MYSALQYIAQTVIFHLLLDIVWQKRCENNDGGCGGGDGDEYNLCLFTMCDQIFL